MKKKYIDKYFIICLAIITFAFTLNAINYIMKTSILDLDYNSFGFLQYVKERDLGDFISIGCVIIISIGATTQFINELRSGYFKKIIVKEPYNKYINRSILKCYIKSLAYVPLASIIIFIIGCILYPALLHKDTTGFFSRMIEYKGIYDPKVAFMFFCLSTLLSAVFSFLVVNITLIMNKKTKNLAISVIGTFLIITFMSFISNLLIAPILNLDLNVYYGYYQGSWSNLISGAVVCFPLCIATYCIMKKLYKNKEQAVLDND
ncbi:MAG: hypothetical protein RSB87_05630 [Clostridia bacterium]